MVVHSITTCVELLLSLLFIIYYLPSFLQHFVLFRFTSPACENRHVETVCLLAPSVRIWQYILSESMYM
jgi:hypothetical protein